jgi:predicted Rossmann fold flavoprotein
MGLSLENAECSVICEGKVIETRFGDMLFTHFGLSGPIIYDLSAIICDLLARGKIVFVSINLKPALDAKKIDGRLKREFLAQPSKALKNILAALLPKQLASEFLIYCSLDESKRVNQVTKEERKKIVDGLFDFRFEIIKTKSIKDAIITRGGVSTKEINPKTMESKIIKGVYFAGELIDVDAKTGGYNMQAAFSTGYVAGENL